MKRILISSILLLILCISIYFVSNNKYNNTNDDRTIYKVYSQIGDEILIKADKLVSASGFAGSSNHIFYLIDNYLYYRNISSINNKEELIATGVEDLFFENTNVFAKLTTNGKILISNSYINYK